jgi:hypothetical protein
MRLPVTSTLLALLFISACSEHLHPAITDAPGCYALTYGPWSETVGGTPPTQIALDTVKAQGSLIPWRENPHVMRPNIPQTRSPVPAVWYVDTLNVLHLIWNTGYSGYRLAVTQQPNGELAGTMTYFSDDHPFPEPPPPRGSVRGHHISCAVAGL